MELSMFGIGKKSLLSDAGNLVLSLFLGSLVVLVMMGAAYGLGLPYRFPVVSAGVYEVGTFESGLSVYQFDEGGVFFTMSPVNDFLFDKDGYRYPIMTWDDLDLIIAREAEVEEKKLPDQWEDLMSLYDMYFGEIVPEYVLEADGFVMTYTGKIEGDRVRVKRVIDFDSAKLLNGQGITVNYGMDDIVFDSVSGQIFSQTDAETMRWVERVYGIKLTDTPAEIKTLRMGERKAVSVISPGVPGMITVEASLNQDLAVDNGYRLIEISEREFGWNNKMEIEFVMTIDSNLGGVGE